jgi:hypothetical protein
MPQFEYVEPSQIGSVAPPTFLERWGVLFLACAGGWVIAIGTTMVVYYFLKAPAVPDLSHLTPDQAQQALSIHKQLQDQWRESLTALFDLLVTRTVLPIVTLLLGYLFGKKE